MLRLAVLGVFLAALVFAAAALAYRAKKLAILEPKALAAPIAWSGQPNARCVLLMVGDSHVARWPAPGRAGWRIGRLGFAGEAAANIAPAAVATIASTRPQAVLIAAGTNDASAAALQWRGANETLDRAVTAVDLMILAARNAGARRVIVLNMVPPRFPEAWRRVIYGERQAAMLDALSRRIAQGAELRGAELIDAAALARGDTGQWDRELRADALHWSPEGYAVLDAALWARLEGACP